MEPPEVERDRPHSLHPQVDMQVNVEVERQRSVEEWSLLRQRMATPRIGAAAVVHGGNIYIMGGWSGE